LLLLAGISACYEIDPYVPDPDTIYTPGKRITPRMEKELAASASLYLELGTLVVLNLEHFNTPSGDLGPDTDSNGTDAIRYLVEDTSYFVFIPEETTDYVVRFWDEAMDSMYFSAYNTSEKITVRLAPGKYVMRFSSMLAFGADTANVQPLFIQPDLELGSKAGSELKYWYMMCRTLECVKCDLKELDFSGMYLVNADLERADLSEANLDGADLKGAQALYSDFSDASMKAADIRGANLSFGLLRNVNLTDADLGYAILNAVDLSGARLYGANFCLATKNGWIIENVKSDTTTLCFP
ncbi:MAG TPA: pentapeptide repeat-containing protein, partial [Bacteroidales bacterium]|nr:pentapeptide repeat-containing protein [Bacteroidales bacterium]